MVDREEIFRELEWWHEDLRGVGDQHRFAVEVLKFYDRGQVLLELVQEIPTKWHEYIFALLRRPLKKYNPREKMKHLYGWEIIERVEAGETLEDIASTEPMLELKTIQNLYYKARKQGEEMKKMFSPIK